ncbi:MAG: hypothetical protein JWQ78_138 [Sediminibacterium sp.]|nr:hypothetical protein [Sediminibacterium sp.]
MERVGTLINKLKEQFEQQASADKMAVTAQLLLVELQKNHIQSTVTSKISVVLPSVSGTVFKPDPESPAPVAAKKETPANNWMFDSGSEIPTLAHQERFPEAQPADLFEFNKILSKQVESVNEKLKEDRVEVVNALQGTPIRDLKKAIGVNDRYLFVHDLFRGDENMYERSIKTINSFTIYAEAQYWIQRELKVKLSWPDNSDTVSLFDQLIKRRFS